MQMGLERDEVLLRQHVCNLCEVGEDADADEAVLAVTKNTDALALSLLEIAGIRLALLMDPRVSDDALAIVAKVRDVNQSTCDRQAPQILR
jgi:5,10-methenyltetrahydromethanopterin hydrogenase